MGQKDETSPGDFLAFNNGMIVAILQMSGHWANEKDELNMDRPNDPMTWEIKEECC